MRPTNWQVVPVLAIFLCLTVWAGLAQAAHEFYVTIEGTKQGAFKGEGVGRAKGRIPCLSFSYQPSATRDVASGQASGKRQHAQIVIVKEVGAASPQIYRAVATHEVLSQVSFEFVHAAPDGREEVYKTLLITKALVASVRTLASGSDKPREEVTLTFEQGNLEAKGPDAKPLPVEHWMGIQK